MIKVSDEQLNQTNFRVGLKIAKRHIELWYSWNESSVQIALTHLISSHLMWNWTVDSYVQFRWDETSDANAPYHSCSVRSTQKSYTVKYAYFSHKLKYHYLVCGWIEFDCGRTDVRTDGWTFLPGLLGHLKRWPKNGTRYNMHIFPQK